MCIFDANVKGVVFPVCAHAVRVLCVCARVCLRVLRVVAVRTPCACRVLRVRACSRAALRCRCCAVRFCVLCVSCVSVPTTTVNQPKLVVSHNVDFCWWWLGSKL
jgi:hypothetical protein